MTDTPAGRSGASLNLCRLVFIVAGIAWYLGLFLWPAGWQALLGPLHNGQWPEYPFLDMHGRLAAFEAHAQGFPVLYESNPLDPKERTSLKPSWALWPAHLGIDRTWLVPLSLTTLVLWFALVFRLVRPRVWHETVLACLLLISPAVMLGVERANDDLVYFLLIALAVLILGRQANPPAWRTALSAGLLFLLAPAKYYPGAAFSVFLLNQPAWKRLLVIYGPVAVGLGLVVWFNWEEIAYLRQYAPAPFVGMAHGSGLLWIGTPLKSVGSWLSLAGLAGILAGAFVLLRRQEAPKLATVSLRRGRFALAGISVLFFCFFLNSNYDYRFIYFLMIVPALFVQVRTGSASPSVVAGSWVVLLGMVFILWSDGLYFFFSHDPETGTWDASHYDTLLRIKHAVNWIVMAGLTGFATLILRPSLRALTGRAHPSSDTSHA
ncbi:MAG: hypothetical protein ACFE0O_09195 [Opitutales bacterium]